MDVSGAVDAWVRGSLPLTSDKGFAQIDLDDLLEDEPRSAASLGLECLERVLNALPLGTDLDALLTIPLDPAAEWDNAPPSLDALLEQDWSYGPGRSVPGLYLIHPLQWRVPEQVEEHKWPLHHAGLPPRLVAYYRAWRGSSVSEFDRCVYVRSRPV